MAEYEKYHGSVLRSIVTSVDSGLHIRASDAHGIVNCFVINDRAGIVIKHSSKRMSPWTFYFNSENCTEIELLLEETGKIFVCLVCGFDGFAMLSKDEFDSLKSIEKGDCYIHIKRRKNQMYSVGGKNKLSKQKPCGVTKEAIHSFLN